MNDGARSCSNPPSKSPDNAAAAGVNSGSFNCNRDPVFQLELGEKALQHGVIPTADLDVPAADDQLLTEQILVVGGPVLAALIRVQEQLLRFHLPVAKDPMEGLDH